MGLKQRISREYLVNNIGEKNIFEYYFGQPIEIGKAYHSFFTKDSEPSTGFYVSKHGTIIYNDLRSGEKLDFALFVKKIINKSYYETLYQVAVDFGLQKGIPTNKVIGKIQPFNKVVDKKEKAKIVIKTKSYTKEDLEFWGQFYITRKELIKYNIVSVLWYQISDFTIHTQDELCFAYLIKDKDNIIHTKIYRPLDKKYKWQSNVPLNCVQGLDDIDCNGETLIISKSLKDYIVLKKLYKNVIYLQNESKASITREVLQVLKKCYKRIYVWFDMDRPGLKAINYYKKTYGFTPLFISDNNLNIWQNLSKYKETKDPSDFVKKYDLEELEKFLINKLK